MSNIKNIHFCWTHYPYFLLFLQSNVSHDEGRFQKVYGIALV